MSQRADAPLRRLVEVLVSGKRALVTVMVEGDTWLVELQTGPGGLNVEVLEMEDNEVDRRLADLLTTDPDLL